MPPTLVRDWKFHPSLASRYFRRLRVKDLLRLRLAPESKVLRPASPFPGWVLYFIFLPDATLTPAHRFTLARLRATRMRLIVICATPRSDDVPLELYDGSDALIWKDLPGFDFSAYALGLRHIARRSPGADILVLNDSVLGPFADLDRMMARAQWDLTGITGSQNDENHIQSYAFVLRNLRPLRLWQLRSVFLPWLAFHEFSTVVRSQETRLARVASSRMSVGALWFDKDPANRDPTLFTALELLDDGFPFVKKSALAKFRHVVGETTALELGKRIEAFGHPPFPPNDM